MTSTWLWCYEYHQKHCGCSKIPCDSWPGTKNEEVSRQSLIFAAGLGGDMGSDDYLFNEYGEFVKKKTSRSLPSYSKTVCDICGRSFRFHISW